MNGFLESNRELWDEWTDIHESSDFYRLKEFRGGGIRLRDHELEQVGDVHGKSLLHLQCHFGIDTLSWARLGASVTGADFSPKAIALATRLASDLGLDARFVESDVYDLPERLEGAFDIVYTSRGVLNWLPDIRGWARVVAHFMKAGGIFFITEAHPIAWAPGEEQPLAFRYAYWEHSEPQVFEVEGSYADPSADVKTEKEYKPDSVEGELPLFYSLRARRPA